jgi:hypothetical protein
VRGRALNGSEKPKLALPAPLPALQISDSGFVLPSPGRNAMVLYLFQARRPLRPMRAAVRRPDDDLHGRRNLRGAGIHGRGRQAEGDRVRLRRLRHAWRGGGGEGRQRLRGVRTAHAVPGRSDDVLGSVRPAREARPSRPRGPPSLRWLRKGFRSGPGRCPVLWLSRHVYRAQGDPAKAESTSAARMRQGGGFR